MTDKEILLTKTKAKLSEALRALGHQLAWEEVSDVNLSGHKKRKFLHEKLLRQLYRIEHRV